jgi:Contractile injection system tube protein
MTPVNVNDPVRGFLASVGLDPRILVRFQFNPMTVADKRTAGWASLSAPGALLPVRQYTSGGERTITFSVAVDARWGGVELDDDGGIAPELTKYRAFLHPSTPSWPDAAHLASGFTGLYAGRETVFEPPPAARFGFGDRVVDCVVTEVTVTETLHTPTLAPLRAEIAVSLVEINPYVVAPTGRPS